MAVPKGKVSKHGILITDAAEKFGIAFQAGGNIVTWFSLILYRPCLQKLILRDRQRPELLFQTVLIHSTSHSEIAPFMSDINIAYARFSKLIYYYSTPGKEVQPKRR